ncbi:MAG: hypothetical protein ACOY82_06940 [Pseudomonadota bacterium]
MKKIGFVLVLASVFLSTGLGRYVYREPAADQPHATLSITSDRKGVAKVQMFSEFKDAQCTPPGNVMAAFNWAKKKDRTLRLRPDETIHILGTVQQTLYGHSREYPGLSTEYCNSVARITPVAGKAYRLSQATSGGCPIELVDAETGLKPPEVEWLPITPGCGGVRLF